MLTKVLDHKNVAIANIAWAVLHVWIALEIEEYGLSGNSSINWWHIRICDDF